ncbi:diaminobutyrate--pyruvate transaminase [Gloeobacter violaceus PCC 7421]|uniref:Diaminobutyrate--2-oxoglutarate transaminase n=2 Tax=Gloeobacter violaceus TaxID=33072 RepID=Q7NIG0_GLOVI|nr:diaminobutyrate--pyruvate transaminase [Gloeobacter violaceus PCC 7421]
MRRAAGDRPVAGPMRELLQGPGVENPPASSGPYLQRQAQRESNARSYPRRIPFAFKKAEGVYLTSVEGKQYIDCLAGAGALPLGHNHPVAIQAIQTVIRGKFPLLTLDLPTPLKDRFVDELFACLPAEFARNARIQFCSPAGTDAVEAALKLVKTATARRGILSFQGAYHGMSHGSLSLTGNLAAKVVPNLMPEVQFLPYPYELRCPFGLGGEVGYRTGLHYIENLLKDPEGGVPSPAGIILEVVQGEGGVIPAPDEWLRGLRRITQEQQIPLIVDEIQTGFGRTGKLFAFEHSGIVPDVLLLSKAIGGGLPLAVVVYRESLDRWQPGAHAGTFRGNQLAMATGLATLRHILEHRLWEHAQVMGERLLTHLHQIRSSWIGEVRGRGLMLGVEIVDPTGEPDYRGIAPHAGAMARRIQAECLERGVIVEVGGRDGSVVRFLPPLIVTDSQIDTIAEVFHDAVHAATRITSTAPDSRIALPTAAL